MDPKRLDELIVQIENYLECWKQFNHYLGLARTKKFNPEDEAQFLEIKSVLAQELEIILSVVECSSPSKEEVLALVSSASSLRYLGEQNEASMRGMENQWHKIYIGWQSILGQLKVQQRQIGPTSVWSNIFGKKKS
jgi:hypothetical protein